MSTAALFVAAPFLLVVVLLAACGMGRFLIGFLMMEEPFAPDTDAYDEPPHGV